MEILTYKTNINSEAAMKRVAPVLNNLVGPANWQLDIDSLDKRLTLYADSVINELQISAAIQKAGFVAVNIDDYLAIY